MNLRQNHLHSLRQNHLYSFWQNIHQNLQHLHHQKKNHGSGSKHQSAGLIKQKTIAEVQVILLLAKKTKRAMEESMRKKKDSRSRSPEKSKRS